MEHNYTNGPNNNSWSQYSTRNKKQTRNVALLAWWYRLAAPPEPPITASIAQRERARHGKLASITIPIFMLFLLSFFPPVIASKDPAIPIIELLLGLTGSILALFLNRRGFTEWAGMLVLFIEYVGGTLTMLNYPHGLTVNDLPMLDFTIIPDVLVLAFFSANTLFAIAFANAFQIWIIVVDGPHSTAITQILQTSPSQIFYHVYVLQLITVIVLYLCARSTEIALGRADRAEVIITFERQEKERQEQELERKRQLDAGIQQILQTHVDVANGDFGARAPLHQDHVLWQVAVALNNLIARLQSLNHTERELRQQMWEDNERTTGHHPAFGSHKTNERATGHHPAADLHKTNERATGHHPAADLHKTNERATGHHPAADLHKTTLTRPTSSHSDPPLVGRKRNSF